MALNLAKDKALLAVIAITIIYFAYWVAFAFNAYNTFHEYDDLGLFAHNMWLDIHYPNTSPGLQYLVLGNHISLDLLLILPFFYLAQSSLTLLIIQAFVISATAIALFLIARDLLKSQMLAFVFFFTFIINPGVNGMLVFDFHPECFITLFFILTFYFYMKQRKALFIISSLLLLGTIEEAPFLGIALGIGLIVYELLHNRKSSIYKQRLQSAALLIMLSIALLFVYDAITLLLENAYASSAYANMPPYLKLLPWIPNFLHAITSGFSGSTPGYEFFPGYTAYGIIAGILFLGTAVLINPIITLILTSPYLTEVFLLGNYSFVFVFVQNFGFVIGPTLVSGMIGILILQNIKSQKTEHTTKGFKNIANTLYRSIIPSIIFINIILLLLYPIFVYSKNVNNLSQDFFFHVSSTQRNYIEQLKSIMALIPSNASLVAPYFTTPQLMGREYLEDTGYNMKQWYFQPEYILIDMNLNISLNALVSYSQLNNYLRYNQSNYELYAMNGTAMLLKRK